MGGANVGEHSVAEERGSGCGTAGGGLWARVARVAGGVVLLELCPCGGGAKGGVHVGAPVCGARGSSVMVLTMVMITLIAMMLMITIVNNNSDDKVYF